MIIFLILLEPSSGHSGVAHGGRIRETLVLCQDVQNDGIDVDTGLLTVDSVKVSPELEGYLIVVEKFHCQKSRPIKQESLSRRS